MVFCSSVREGGGGEGKRCLDKIFVNFCHASVLYSQGITDNNHNHIIHRASSFQIYSYNKYLHLGTRLRIIFSSSSKDTPGWNTALA